jgi:hypothetical protein
MMQRGRFAGGCAVRIAIGVLACSLAIAGCGEGSEPDAGTECASGSENTPAACSDGCSNDGDTAIDCADADCAGIGACATADAGPGDAGSAVDAGPVCASGVESDVAACGDGCDNDGDSDIDCDDSECIGVEGCNECAPGDMDIECGPPDETGACTFGRRFCGIDGTWGACEDAVLPVEEECNGGTAETDDEDCDGVIDNGCDCINGDPRVCQAEGAEVGLPSICTAVTQTCADGVWPRDCGLESFTSPGTEACEGTFDEDCDGAVDEGGSCPCTPMGATRPCGTDTGACVVGTETCGASGWMGCTAVLPVTETCDSMDNDCDSRVDEGVRNACNTCGAPPSETCDGLDNDCDTRIDEGLPRPSTADERETNNTWATAHDFTDAGPAQAASGGRGTIEDTGSTTFHDGDPSDAFVWYENYSSWDNRYVQYWMCRVTSLQPAQRVTLNVGVFIPHMFDGNFNLAACDTTLNCFDYHATCTGVQNNGTCRVAIPIGAATAGSAYYAFGVRATPTTGWSTCEVSYDLDCRLTTFTTW